MLGTISLIALFALGYMQYHILVIVPFAILNGAIGYLGPSGRKRIAVAEKAKETGTLLSLLVGTFVLQTIPAIVIYFLGYGVRLVVERLF